jgi:hypothetical protein
MIIRHGTNLTENRVLTVPVSRIIRHVTNLTDSEDRYMTNDHREAGTVYPRFSVRFVTWRMIIEKQELFTPVFSGVRYMTDDHREAW